MVVLATVSECLHNTACIRIITALSLLWVTVQFDLATEHDGKQDRLASLYTYVKAGWIDPAAPAAPATCYMKEEDPLRPTGYSCRIYIV